MAYLHDWETGARIREATEAEEDASDRAYFERTQQGPRGFFERREGKITVDGRECFVPVGASRADEPAGGPGGD